MTDITLDDILPLISGLQLTAQDITKKLGCDLIYTPSVNRILYGAEKAKINGLSMLPPNEGSKKPLWTYIPEDKPEETNKVENDEEYWLIDYNCINSLREGKNPTNVTVYHYYPASQYIQFPELSKKYIAMAVENDISVTIAYMAGTLNKAKKVIIGTSSKSLINSLPDMNENIKIVNSVNELYT